MNARMGRVAGLLLLLAACSTPSKPDDQDARRSPLQRDTQCVDDCLGNGGNRQFCEERCTN